MIFKKLTFNNYKTYYGHQEIDLYIPEDIRTDESSKNIILLGGLNGAGKTTFLKAILYILFGKRGISESEYVKLISNIINNTYFEEGGRDASLSLTLETDAGEEWQVKVKWFFNANKKMTHEERELNIRKKDARLPQYAKVESIEAYNKFIDRIIPYYAAPFFFFDGEEIKDIITRQDKEQMHNTIKKITGMEANTQLLRDLTAIKSTLETKIAKAISSKEQSAYKDKLDELNQSIEQTQIRVRKYANSIKSLTTNLNEIKNSRNAKLLQNSNSRDKILGQYTRTETTLKIAREELDNYLKINSLKIILNQKLEKLKKRLRLEKTAREKALLKDASLAPYRSFMDKLLTQTFNPPLIESQLVQIKKIGEDVWMKENSIKHDPNYDINEIHDLTPGDMNHLLNIPILDKYQVTQLINKVDRLQNDLEQVEIEMKNAPDAIDVTEDDKKIEEFTKELGEIQLRYNTARTKLKKLEEEHTIILAKMTKLAALDSNAEELSEQLDYVTRSIMTLTKYVAELTIIKTTLIKEEFDQMLRLLFRKQDEFGKIEFDTNSFTIRLYNDRMQEISILERSAGELQMISSALIWALTKASDLELPMVIDTPLGRLDSYHRNHLINHYYNQLSQQVIILSTDTEITSDYVEIMRKYSYKQYMLDYDEKKKYTIIRDGYFEFLRG